MNLGTPPQTTNISKGQGVKPNRIKKKPFFSLVVPCCDVEPYIEECIQSVLNQSFQEWECIFGIEASKDRTEEVIRKCTAGDARFRIFTGPRTGSCSVPRNKGIDMAQGEYIIFLDGDDMIADGCLERLHKKISANPEADLYPCTVVLRNEIKDDNQLIRQDLFNTNCWDNYGQDAPAEMSGVEATIYVEHFLHSAFSPMLQMTVHRREFLIKHGLKCVPGLRCQDNEFSPRALYLAKRIVPLHEPFYLYRIRSNSIQTAARKPDHFMKDWAIITKSRLAFYDKVSQEQGFDIRVAQCWERQWFSRLVFVWFFPKHIRTVPREKRVEHLKFIFEDNGFDIYKRMVSSASLPRKIIAKNIQMFVKHPSLRLFAEFFFRVYYGISKLKNSASKKKICP